MPEPVTFYPLNARYRAAEKENRQPEGNLGDVAITNGPYNEPGGAYMFYGTVSSYIEFPNNEILDTRFSKTLMCWVEPGGQDGPLFSNSFYFRDAIWIKYGRFLFAVRWNSEATSDVLTTGKWVHVAASYDHNTGINSIYINGHLSAPQNIKRPFVPTTLRRKVRMGSTGDRHESFKGKIAEMKVYDVALNEAQIQTSIRQGNCTFSIIVVSLPFR